MFVPARLDCARFTSSPRASRSSSWRPWPSRRSVRTASPTANESNTPGRRVVVLELVPVVKQALASARDARGVLYGSRRTELTSRLVTIFIEEFYGGPDARRLRGRTEA